ncbi:MAG: hypothetical protein JRJ42_04520 [Deltaproteobacteria bacterium]|nr:hypothetical protein [Deltaproteobacteria bacterium]RLB82929.1 MAG: hypothetical protein DRH17_04020 [Deltaproteobacteria bacterium]
MLDVAVSYNRYKFLGHEYLTWLWFVIEKGQHEIRKLEQEPVSLQIGNRIVLVNRQKDTVESITIKGDDAGLEEGILALRKGAVVTELNLSYKMGDQEWRFTVKAESLHMVGLKCPQTGSVESQEDIEGAVLEKVYLYDKAIQLTDNLFKQFITLRVSEDWDKKVVPLMRQWIYS